MEKGRALEIKNILGKLLRRLHIPYFRAELDQGFHAACVRAMIDRGVSLDGDVHVGPYIPLGVTLATTAYAHIQCQETRIYIAIYTASLVSVEDVCSNDHELLKAFCYRFLKGIPHGHPILDTYDKILRELPDRYDLVVADMMLQSNMDFIVALVLEYEMQERPISSHARGFPIFLRNLSGVAKMYSMLAYPREVPLRSYVEVIPASITYVNFINDIFSFYKEELVNETVNCISNIALCNGWTKINTLKNLADESVRVHDEAVAVLSQDPAVLEAYMQFYKGYVYFHTSTPRYKIAELWSMGSKKDAALSCSPETKSSRALWVEVLMKSLIVLTIIATVTVDLLRYTERPVWFPTV